MKIVSPYRPFEPESAAHRKLGAFDWIAALSMLRASVRQSCACETYALTDVDTVLPAPAHHYATTQARLMLWIVEVSLCYLRSDDFDQDTVLVSPDVVVTGDLRRWFRADLGVVVRFGPKYVTKPILNAVQFWRHAAKEALIAFYAEALRIAETLPEGFLRWGADTEPIRQLVSPIVGGGGRRLDLSVAFLDHHSLFAPVSTRYLEHAITGGGLVRFPQPIVDFKGLRKHSMAAYVRATAERQAVPA